jgi:sugar lactone lactonase YvrE
MNGLIMLKSACPHVSVMAVVFAFSMFFASQGAVGGGLDWGGGGGSTPPPTLDPVLRDVVATVGKFQAPTRIALSHSSNIYVTDRAKGVVFIYDATGKGIGALRGLTTPAGLAVYDQPEPDPVECDEERKKGWDVALANMSEQGLEHQNAFGKDDTGVDKPKKKDDGDSDACSSPPSTPPQPIIYVGDDSNGSVKIFNNGDVSLIGSGSGEFITPNGIAVTEDQSIYVVDSKAHQVKVYDNFATLQFTFGSQGSADGQFDFPIDIVLNELLGEVYISDFWNGRIVVFDLAGNWLRNIITPLNDGGGQAYFRPSGLGIDPDGYLYVVDNALSCVAVITNTGTLIDIIGYSNEQYWIGEITLPLDAAADGQFIYVISGQERMVKVFNGVAP